MTEPVDFHVKRAELAERGIRVQIAHERLWNVSAPGGRIIMTSGEFHSYDRITLSDVFVLSAKGGRTNCRLIDRETGNLIGGAETFVHPNDLYCKKTGRDLALARAIEALEK